MRRAPFDPSLPEKAGNQVRTLLTLFPYLWPRDRPGLRVRVVFAMAFLVGAKVMNVYAPFFWGAAVDRLTATQGAIVAIPVGLVLGYAISRVLVTSFGELRDWLFVRVGQNAIRSVALKTFKHLHGLSLRFHVDRQTGGLSRGIERGTKGIQFLLNFSLFNILPTFIEIAIVSVILYVVFGVWYALIAFGSVAFYVYFTIAVTEWRLKYRRAMNSADTEANTKAVDSLLNFETVKYFGNEAHESARFDRSLKSYESAAVKSQTSLSLLNMGQAVVMYGGLAALLLMGAIAVSRGTMTVGQFTMVNMFLMQLYMPLNFLGFVYREIKQSLVDMEVMFDLLEVGAEIRDSPGVGPLAVPEGVVEFDHVTFGYNPDRTILRDVSFRVPAGHTVALVGASGAGKSTISRILYRFYDVDHGAVRIDGQDLRDVSQASLREAIGVVPQDTVLFNDTIGYNIAYGKPGASQAEIEAAARLASIHRFVTGLPEGYETRVGERGLKLSGGEKQRVAIARTMLKDPPILLFDEATSALDSHTEKEIQASLRDVSAGRTTLIIAHRLSTVIHADEILFLDGGRIVERGTHRRLLALDGVYAGMWNRQQEAAEHEARLAEAVGAA
ncbi:MAG: ABC transporter ATP-binding protein/permease [Proteobacteria bacterium]|nr:ABC transporter ATP-binding protein/permease [Pseudomonadota bacterium]